jgi:hypothetical protein
LKIDKFDGNLAKIQMGDESGETCRY